MEINEAYRKLGLTQGATEEQVKAAYKQLAQRYNPDVYDAGPLRDDAKAHMDEVNGAFDAVMSALRMAPRAGGAASGAAGGAEDAETHRSAQFMQIRQLINTGDVETALAQLNTISGGAESAEWNFLVGSAYYYKGWLSDAQRYFEAAYRLAPDNREYEAALNNLNRGARGGMYGNPYEGQSGGMQGAGCSCCDMCTAMMCMDMCCNCGRGC